MRKIFILFLILIFSNTVNFGSILTTPPTVPSSNISFSSYTNTRVIINWTSGNGARRIVVVKQGSAVDWVPSDNVALSGINSNFSTATNQGNGNKVVYNGTGIGVSVTGLISGQTYHVAVFEYNGVNTGVTPNAAYLTTGVPVANFTTLVPSVSVNPTSLSGFSASIGGTSSEQTYTVSANEVFGTVNITAPANFMISLVSGGPYSSSLSISQANYSVPNTTVYVVFAPTSGSPGGRTGTITNRSAGAPNTANVSVSGTVTASAPTISASNIVFSNVYSTNLNISWTNGNGTLRMVVIKQGTPVDWIPSNNTLISGVNANFNTALNQGGGNKVVYNGSGNNVTVSGLTSGTTYYVTIYEYNGSNTSSPYTAVYLTSGAPSDFFATTTPIITVNPASLTQFNTYAGGVSNSQSYAVSATGLFKNLTITSPSNFEISTSSLGPWTSNIILTPSSGTISTTTIFVRFVSSGMGVVNGNITNSSSGAITRNVAVSGNAVDPVYTWSGASSLDWQNPLNWSPARYVPSTLDTLKFINSPAGPITNVPTESIEKLQISGPSTTVDLYSATDGNTLSLHLASASGIALSIAEGCQLNISGTNVLSISLNSLSSADVRGDINLSGANHILSNTGSWNFGENSTVSYLGGSNQTVVGLNFNNLTIGGEGTTILPITLILAGNFTNNSTGSVNHNNGTVTFTGISKTIGGTSVTTFNNLTLGNNATVAISNAVNLSGTLTLGTSSVFTTTGQNFTILSTVSQTGRIAAIPAGANIVGNISVQRFIPATSGRYWYHLGAPVSGAPFTQLRTSATSLPPDPDNGFFITGSGIGNTTPNIPSIGITNTTIASVYSYDAATAQWVKPSDLANSFPSKVGYRFFIRDGSAAVAPSTGAKLLTMTGGVVSGTQIFNLDYSNASPGFEGYNFIANPYPSNITADLSSGGWNTTSANLANNTVYIWDSEAGQYVSCLNGVESSSGACTIPSFQGFWVQTNPGGGALSSNENVKVAGSTVLFKASAFSSNLPIRVRNLSSGRSHGTVIRFEDDATVGYDSHLDALQLFAMPEEEQDTYISICSELDGKKYAINTIPGGISDTINLNIVAPAGDNLLEFNNDKLQNGESVYLLDKQSGNKYDLQSTSLIKFTASENESVSERFALVFNNGNKNSNTNQTSGNMVLYPNPSKGGSVNVLLDNIQFNKADLIVYDSFGRVVYRQNTNSNNNLLNLSHLTPGIYTVLCVTDSGSLTERIAIE